MPVLYVSCAEHQPDACAWHWGLSALSAQHSQQSCPQGSRTAPLNSGGPYGLFGGRQLDIQKYYLNVNSMACKAPCSLVTFKILPMVQHAQAFDRLLAILPEDAVRQGEQVIQKLRWGRQHLAQCS